jgi:hypothetical protein
MEMCLPVVPIVLFHMIPSINNYCSSGEEDITKIASTQLVRSISTLYTGLKFRLLRLRQRLGNELITPRNSNFHI